MPTRLERLKKRKTKLATNIVKAVEAGKTKKASRAVVRAERKAPKLKKKIANTKARVAKRVAKLEKKKYSQKRQAKIDRLRPAAKVDNAGFRGKNSKTYLHNDPRLKSMDGVKYGKKISTVKKVKK